MFNRWYGRYPFGLKRSSGANVAINGSVRVGENPKVVPAALHGCRVIRPVGTVVAM